MKIIVTGGCGYIGSHTVVELIEAGFKVVVFDNLSNSNEFILDRIKTITDVKPEFVNVDLSDESQSSKAFKIHSDAKAIIHFAAYKAVGESIEKPVEYYKNNLFSLLNCIKEHKNNSISHFIFSSSATVYGDSKNLPITENKKTQRPFSPYGNTKKIAEEILEDVCNSDISFKSICLRYFNPIGAHKSGLIGELPNGIPNNLLPFVTQCAAGVLDELKVFGKDYNTPDGTAIRDYIHVVDLAKAHVAALQKLLASSNQNFDIINLGTGKGYSVLDIIKTFEKVNGIAIKHKFVNRREGDVEALYASTEKAKKVLNWEAKHNLEDMLSSSWNWEKSYRNLN